MDGIEKGKAEGVLGARPVGIGEHEDVAVGKRPGFPVHVDIGFVQVLEVQHPVVHQVLVVFRGEEMGLDHEIFFEADIGLGRVKGAEPASIHRLPENGRKFSHIHPRFPHNLPCGGAPAHHGTVVHQQDVAPGRQSLPFGTVHRHARKLHCSGTGPGKIVRFAEIGDGNHVVSVKRGLNGGSRLGLYGREAIGILVELQS